MAPDWEQSTVYAVTTPGPPTADAGWELWTGFSISVTAALALDLFWGARKAVLGHHVRQAVLSSVAWLSLGIAFAGFLAVTRNGEVGFIFLTGYLVEKSLSVDNLVVIALIFRSFRIKTMQQGPVLKWGILGAVFFRTIFIFAGVALLEHFAGAVYLFGLLLLYSAYKMLMEDDDEHEEEAAQSHKTGKSCMMRCMLCFIPYLPEAEGNQFILKIDRRHYATPLLAALIVVELSDLLFAVDSIPCILGLTQDLFLVFSSNMLAILGLRSLYILLAEALEGVRGLKRGLAAVLVFVGVKMMMGHSFPLPHHMSLLVIFGILGLTVAASMLCNASPNSATKQSSAKSAGAASAAAASPAAAGGALAENPSITGTGPEAGSISCTAVKTNIELTEVQRAALDEEFAWRLA